MPARIAGRVVLLLSFAGAAACSRDVWTYNPRTDAGTADVAVDVPAVDVPAVDVPVDAACPSGRHPLGGACVVDAPPRALAPISLGDVTQRRPTLRWALPSGFDGAVVELCRDRACAMVIETLTVRGSSARPTRDLPPRSAVFWRMRGRAGSMTDAVSSPPWLFHVPATSASTAVDSSGRPHLDLDGDGFDDIVVGAYQAHPGGRPGAGTASVFRGSATGVAATATTVLEGVAAGDRFGIAVRSAGDVNGDGYGDLVVGADAADPGARPGVGTASVFLGSPSGVAATAARVLRGVAEGDMFGANVAGAGDVDGDGYADIVVGAMDASPGGRTAVGSASVFLGGAEGTAANAARVLEGRVRGERFGYAVAGAGDVDGDGFGDVLVASVFGAPGGRINAGTVGVFLGSASGVPMVAARVLEGVAEADQFGNTLATAGDLNGDGYSDVVVGANGADPGGRSRAGTASVFHGSAAGIPMAPARVLEGVADVDQFSSGLCGAGDVNGDGYGDLLVGAVGADPGGRTEAGALSVFLGSASGVPATPALVVAGVARDDNFGFAAAGAGDVNGDGYGDALCTAWHASPGGRFQAGSTSLFHGSASGLAATPNTVFDGAAQGDLSGVAVASAPSMRPSALLLCGG